ncbi:MAG: hypothetical protein JW737_04140 [Acidobacteria bacterium]|nr:hypothetical protein [Acidobacteriota bacterium]
MKKVVLMLLVSCFLFTWGFTGQEGQNELFAQSRKRLPDLVGKAFVENGSCRLWLQLKNIGNALLDNKSFRIVVIAHGIVVYDDFQSTPIAPGGNFSFGIGNFTVKEKTRLKIILDADNTIKEKNEANNEIRTTVECEVQSFTKPVELVQTIPTALQPVGSDLAVDPVVIIGESQQKVKNGGTVTLTRDDSYDNSRAFYLKYYMLNLKGKAVSGIKNEVYYNGVSVATQTDVSIGVARAEISLQMYPTFGKTGDYGTVKIVVDSDNKLNEPDETNNTITFYVKLQGY